MNQMPITLADRRAQTGDAAIAYGVRGEKRAAGEPAIVLLHGFCGSSAYWEAALPYMEGEGRFVVPDLRGHGASDAPARDVYPMEAIADDIAALLDRLEEERAIVVGHSLGGYAALAFAERHPERLAAFGLVHSTAHPDSDEAKANRDKAAAAIRESGIAPFVDGLVPKLFAPAHAASMADRVARAKAIGRGTSARGAAATALGMKERPDRRHVIAEARVPVLLLAGSEDGVVPPERTFTSPASPAVRHALLEACGHMGMIERPERLAAEISAFARSVFGGSQR